MVRLEAASVDTGSAWLALPGSAPVPQFGELDVLP